MSMDTSYDYLNEGFKPPHAPSRQEEAKTRHSRSNNSSRNTSGRTTEYNFEGANGDQQEDEEEEETQMQLE